MLDFRERQQSVLSASLVFAGGFLLYWSVSALFSASHTPNTVPAVDAFLGSIDWIWLLGLSLLFLLVGTRRFLLSLSRRSQIVAVAIASVGAIFTVAWVGFVALSLNSIGGVIFFSPVLGIGVLLLTVAGFGLRTVDDSSG